LNENTPKSPIQIPAFDYVRLNSANSSPLTQNLHTEPLFDSQTVDIPNDSVLKQTFFEEAEYPTEIFTPELKKRGYEEDTFV